MASYTSKTKVKDLPLRITANGTYFIDAKGASAGLGNFSTVYMKGNFDSGAFAVNITPDQTDDVADLPVTDGELISDGFVNILAKTAGIVIAVTGIASASTVDIWIK